MAIRGIVRFSLVLVAALTAAASSTFAGNVNLIWNPSSGATGYRVYSGSSSNDYTAPPTDVGNTIQATINSMADCTVTFFAVKAYNSAGDSGYSNEILTWPRPEPGAITPPDAEKGTTLNLVINGNNFEPGAIVQFSNAGITVNSVSRNSCAQITANITVSGSAAHGAVDVTVSNTNGISGVSAGQFFVVSSPLPEVQNLRRTDQQP